MKRRHIILTSVLSLALLVGGTFAYFTDRATTTAKGTAGTVAIQLNNMINLLDEDGYDLLGPGDMREAGLELVNMGNKSIDVRTTIALTINSEDYDLVFSGDATTQSEYDLYLADDVAEGFLFTKTDGSTYMAVEAADTADVKGGSVGYIPKDGATPIQEKSVSGNVITYEVPEYSLNGNSDMYDEVETINGIGNYKHVYDYVLVFKNDTSNEWQNSVITIDIVAEAKQHENTGAGWDIISQETITQGSITKKAVDSEDVITK